MEASVGIAALLGLIVLGLAIAVLVAGVRRRQSRAILTGLVGAILGLAVLVPASVVAAGLLLDG